MLNVKLGTFFIHMKNYKFFLKYSQIIFFRIFNGPLLITNNKFLLRKLDVMCKFGYKNQNFFICVTKKYFSIVLNFYVNMLKVYEKYNFFSWKIFSIQIFGIKYFWWKFYNVQLYNTFFDKKYFGYQKLFLLKK